MANRTVTIIRCCKTEKGWTRFKAALNQVGEIKPDMVQSNGTVKGPYPDGHYELRFYEGSKVRYRNVGNDPGKAFSAWQHETNLRKGEGGSTGLPAFDRALTTDEVAYLLHVHSKTIERLTVAGAIPFFRVGTALRFWPSAIAKFVGDPEAAMSTDAMFRKAGSRLY